jgi:hypothetical protein
MKVLGHSLDLFMSAAFWAVLFVTFVILTIRKAWKGSRDANA